ncbi:unnamed protein product, partial [Ectocarpus fasciculatus]
MGIYPGRGRDVAGQARSHAAGETTLELQLLASSLPCTAAGCPGSFYRRWVLCFRGALSCPPFPYFLSALSVKSIVACRRHHCCFSYNIADFFVVFFYITSSMP